MPSIILDSYYQNLFEKLAFQCGIFDLGDIKVPGGAFGTRTNWGTSKLFDMILLADKLDASMSVIDWKKIDGYDLLPEKSVVLGISKPFQRKKEVRSSKDFSSGLAAQILKGNTRRISNDLIVEGGIDRELPKAEAAATDERKVQQIVEYAIPRLRSGSGWVQVAKEVWAEFPMFPDGRVPLVLWQLQRVIRDVEWSCNWLEAPNLLFATRYDVRAPFSSRPLEDQAIQLVRVDFRGKTLGLPKPRNLEEALDLRNTKQIRRLRQKISEWLNTSGGSCNLRKSIEFDIKKATQEITKMKKINKFKEGSIYFLITSIGGHIPIISNIITVLGSIEYVYARHVERNFGWVK